MSSILPDVKLRALTNFPVSVTGRVATKVVKANGRYFIDHDVSGLVKNPTISAGEVAQSWMTIWNETLDSYQNVPYALAATAGVASLDGHTGALDTGNGLTFTGDTLEIANEFETRADAIAATIPIGAKSIRIRKYATGYPEAYATYIPGAGPEQLTEAGGHLWSLDLTNQIPDIAWFGANYTNGVANAAAFNKIAALNTDGGPTGYPMRVGPGTWLVQGSVPFTKHSNKIIGAGSNDTVIHFVDTIPGQTMFQWYLPGSAGGLQYCGIFGVTINRDKTANPAVAIDSANTSGFRMEDVDILNWHDSLSATSIGILSRGREFTRAQNVVVDADYPVFIDENPERSKVLRIDCDYPVFRDVQFGSLGSDSVRSPVIIRDGVNITDFLLEGFNLNGGGHGVEWVATADNLVLAQSRGSAGSLVLNGYLVSGGVGAFGVPRQVGIRSPEVGGGDNSSVTFTVVGTSPTGAPQTDTVTGVGQGNTVFTTHDFATITSISTDRATVGNIISGKSAESVNFGFTVRDGRQEQVTVAGGALVYIDRQNTNELRGVKVSRVLAQSVGMHFTGNITGILVDTLYHLSNVYPPFVIDVLVRDFTWDACIFQQGAPSGVSGQTIIRSDDKRSGEPHGRSGKSVKTSLATLPDASTGYSVATTQVVGPRVTGWNAPTGTTARGSFDSGATLSLTAATLAALIADLRTHGLLGS